MLSASRNLTESRQGHVGRPERELRYLGPREFSIDHVLNHRITEASWTKCDQLATIQIPTEYRSLGSDPGELSVAGLSESYALLADSRSSQK